MRKIKNIPWVGGKREKEGEEKWERWTERERGMTGHELTKVKCILTLGNFVNTQRMVHFLWLLSRIFTVIQMSIERIIESFNLKKTFKIESNP